VADTQQGAGLAPPGPGAITGVILAGGLSRRMSDRGVPVDKGLAEFRGRPMIAWAAERLAGQVDELIVSANRHHERYARIVPRVVADVLPGHAGPLAGLHAAMGAARHPWVLSVPCDSPFLPRDLAARMAARAAEARVPLAVARCEGRDQSVFLLAHRSLAPGIARFLAAGEARVGLWYASIPRVAVDFDEPAAFRNLNTPDDLARFADG
jgi:molybdopterin-guanine dinucleotide biosynthesis protein A